MTEELTENRLVVDKHVLICDDAQMTKLEPFFRAQFEYVKSHFCGRVFTEIASYDKFMTEMNLVINLWGKPEDGKKDGQNNLRVMKHDLRIYLCGDIDQNLENLNILMPGRVYVIKEFSYYDHVPERFKVYEFIGIGKIPLNVNNVGVYFRDFFDFRNIFGQPKNCFELISNEHQFQALTESNKPSHALRTGLYLSDVVNVGANGKPDGIPSVQREEADVLCFNLLRCSSNFNGPTENFRETDRMIISEVNYLGNSFFEQPVRFNHVLAQIYENKTVPSGSDSQQGKPVERKSRISEHSDKTKDMPRNGLMAFCTFYKGYSNNNFYRDDQTKIKEIRRSEGINGSDLFDYCDRGVSVLTRLRFRLKDDVPSSLGLIKKFDLVLSPNSVFLMSLEMNRLYTHEICPSVLPVDRIPIRMGYVIRCSKTQAVFKNDQTFIDQDGVLVKLEPPNQADFTMLRDLYYKENNTSEMIDYGQVNFSMNQGDYNKPTV